MKKWEYRVSQPIKDEFMVDFLNRMGEDGWELIAIEPYQMCVFKREKQ